MKIRSFSLLCLTTLCASLLFLQCSSPKAVLHTTEGRLIQHFIPVVIGLDNPVLEVMFATETEQEFTHIQVSIAGNEAMESIQVRQIVGEEKVPIAALVEVSSLNTIQINRTLAPGEHRFLISVVPQEGASLLDKLEVGVPEILLENQRVEPQKPGGMKPLRLAHKVRHHGDDGVHSYRIPGLATSTKGTLLAIYDIRRESSVDLQEDIDVGLSRSTDGGHTWERMKIIM